MRILLFLFLGAVVLSATSCLKNPPASEIPDIAFKSYSTGDTIDPVLHNHSRFVKLSITFTDGDGDIGLDPNETAAPYDLSGGYYYNLIVTFYRLESGVFVRKTDQKARIPRLTSYANKHGLNGIISQSFVVLEHDNETVRYDIFIYDRALHKSNVITSPSIVLN